MLCPQGVRTFRLTSTTERNLTVCMVLTPTTTGQGRMTLFFADGTELIRCARTITHIVRITTVWIILSKNIDPDGKVVETAWDIANAVYDVGVAIYNHIKGDHETAKSSWIDAGADAVTMIVPFVPAGTTKIVKGAKLAKRGEKASDTVKGVDKVADANHAKDLIKNGRSGRQSRLKELGDDPKLGKADRGWIKQ